MIDGGLGLGNPSFVDVVAHRLGHVPAHEQQQQRRQHPHHEQTAPAIARQNQQAQARRNCETEREGRQNIPRHASPNSTRAELGSERDGDRHLAAETKVCQESEYGERQDVPGRRDEAGEHRENTDRRLEGRSSADVVGNGAPEQRAEESADQTDGGEETGLRRPKRELARNQRQRGAEQGEVGRIEHDPEECDCEKCLVPLREWQMLQPCYELIRLLAAVRHSSLPHECVHVIVGRLLVRMLPQRTS